MQVFSLRNLNRHYRTRIKPLLRNLGSLPVLRQGRRPHAGAQRPFSLMVRSRSQSFACNAPFPMMRNFPPLCEAGGPRVGGGRRIGLGHPKQQVAGVTRTLLRRRGPPPRREPRAPAPRWRTPRDPLAYFPAGLPTGGTLRSSTVLVRSERGGGTRCGGPYTRFRILPRLGSVDHFWRKPSRSRVGAHNSCEIVRIWRARCGHTGTAHRRLMSRPSTAPRHADNRIDSPY